MRKPRTRLSLIALVAIATALAAHNLAPDAEAQCALCRTALEGAGAATARTMNLAILVLLVPPVAIFCAIFAVLKRKDGEDGEE